MLLRALPVLNAFLNFRCAPITRKAKPAFPPALARICCRWPGLWVGISEMFAKEGQHTRHAYASERGMDLKRFL